MLKHNLKIAWRNLLRNKSYSAINIGGLAIGMAVVIMIGLWVVDEFTFNTYHKNHDRIAQIHDRSLNTDTGDMQQGQSLLYIAGTLIKENYADYFEHVLRANWVGNYTLDNGKNVYSRTGEFIESGALEMFSIKMIRGTHASMEDQNAVVLSESSALAIFGNADPIGKSL